MKISKLIALLEQRKEEYGDVLIGIRFPEAGTSFYGVNGVEKVWFENGIDYQIAVIAD